MLSKSAIYFSSHPEAVPPCSNLARSRQSHKKVLLCLTVKQEVTYPRSFLTWSATSRCVCWDPALKEHSKELISASCSWKLSAEFQKKTKTVDSTLVCTLACEHFLMQSLCVADVWLKGQTTQCVCAEVISSLCHVSFGCSVSSVSCDLLFSNLFVL